MASIWGYALHGVEAITVRVEAHVRTGLPGMTIVGLPGAAVKEARERIRSGAAASRLPLPTRRITVNLSPGISRKRAQASTYLWLWLFWPDRTTCHLSRWNGWGPRVKWRWMVRSAR